MTSASSAPPPGHDPWGPQDHRTVPLREPDPERSLPVTAPTPSATHDLRTLVQSRYPAVALETDEEERALQILDQIGWDLRLPVYDWTLTRGLQRRGTEQVFNDTGKPASALANIGELGVEAIYVMRDLRPLLADTAVSRALRDVLERFSTAGRRATIVLLGTQPALPTELIDRVVVYPLGLPSDAEYLEMVKAVGTSLTLGRAAEVALTPEEFVLVAEALRGLTLNQARQAIARVAVEDGVLNFADVARLTDIKAQALSTGGLLEYFPPDDNVATLGGFDGLHRWLARARVGFSPEAKAMNLPAPKGVLLTGVQGCGKSLAAKAIARAWGLPLVKLDAGRLYDKYVGESERNLRRSLDIATSLAPAVLWIDEIEKALATGNGDGTDGGLSQRLLGTLLTWLSEREGGVFLVATANDVFRLPPELMRKGRFDELFFVDLPDAAARAEIFAIHLQMRRQDPASLDLAQLAGATDGFSGAEIEQLVVGTLLGSLQAGVSPSAQAFLDEAASTVPLSRSRAEDIARLRAIAADRFVSVNR